MLASPASKHLCCNELSNSLFECWSCSQYRRLFSKPCHGRNFRFDFWLVSQLPFACVLRLSTVHTVHDVCHLYPYHCRFLVDRLCRQLNKIQIILYFYQVCKFKTQARTLQILSSKLPPSHITLSYPQLPSI